MGKTDNEYYRESLRKRGETQQAECPHERISYWEDRTIMERLHRCDACGEHAEVDLRMLERGELGPGIAPFFERIFGKDAYKRMHYVKNAPQTH